MESFRFCLITGLFVTGVLAVDPFVINVDTSGEYSIQIHNTLWLESAPTFFRSRGKTYSSEDHSLKLTQTTATSGVDNLGKWQTTSFFYAAGGVNITAVIKVYRDLPFIVFEQHFPDGVTGTDSGNPNGVVSGFPCFKVGTQQPVLGYLSLAGVMVGDAEKHLGKWDVNSTGIKDGITGSHLTLFDETGNVVIMSAFSQFMAGSVQHDESKGNINWGIMGQINNIDKGFVYKTGIYYGSKGINKAFEGWGELMRRQYNKVTSYRDSDLTINYLGYWTDNGAYYYYHTPKGKTFEDILLGVTDYAGKMNIPYRYLQYDSWWYYMGPARGVVTWMSRPDVFPHGMEYLFNKTKLPVAAHNRWWSSKTTYAKQNGGQFNFIVESLKAAPNDSALWEFLMKSAKSWGLVMYEQDWLNVEFAQVKAFMTDLHLGRNWLMEMGEAARKNGLTVQYCMANPRHALQSLEIPVVTQARVTNDYSPGGVQWKVGVSSMFAHALGLAPFKDTFWTTTVQEGNPYGKTEPNTELNAAIATLTTGPVGPGDAIGKTNISLLMRCCNKDGLILKPSRPITAIDAQVIQAALQGGQGPVGEVYSTYSEVAGYRFGIILAADLQGQYSITPTRAGFMDNFLPSKVFQGNVMSPSTATDFGEQSPLVLKGCTTTQICLYYTTPILQFGGELLLYGELDKWVPMSPQRITGFSQGGDDFLITLKGAPGENVNFWATLAGKPIQFECNLSPAGGAVISVAGKRCSPV